MENRSYSNFPAQTPSSTFDWTTIESNEESIKRLETLRLEWNRASFDENQRRMSYNESRSRLQEVWDKVVNIRIHIKKNEREIEETKIESILKDSEEIRWDGAIERIQDRTDALTLHNASNLAGVQQIRDKFRLKEVLQSKISTLELSLSEYQRDLLVHSERLRNQTFVASKPNSNVSDNLSLTLVSESMNSRNMMLKLSSQINNIAIDLKEYKLELKRIEKDIHDFIETRDSAKSAAKNNKSMLQTPPNAFYAPQLFPPSTMLNKPLILSEEDNDMLIELVSYGQPLSKDLVQVLVTAGELQSLQSLIQLPIENETDDIIELSLDEVLSGQARIYRINGEDPSLYLNRLQKRLVALKQLELSIVKEFLLLVQAVKRLRELLREAEIKRLRIEIQVTNIEKHNIQSTAQRTNKELTASRFRQNSTLSERSINMNSGDSSSPVPNISLKMSPKTIQQTKKSFFSDTSNFDPKYSSKTVDDHNLFLSDLNETSQSILPPLSTPPETPSKVSQLRSILRSLVGSQTPRSASKNTAEEEQEIITLISSYLDHEQSNVTPSLLDPFMKSMRKKLLVELLENDLKVLNPNDLQHLKSIIVTGFDSFSQQQNQSQLNRTNDTINQSPRRSPRRFSSPEPSLNFGNKSTPKGENKTSISNQFTPRQLSARGSSIPRRIPNKFPNDHKSNSLNSTPKPSNKSTQSFFGDDSPSKPLSPPVHNESNYSKSVLSPKPVDALSTPKKVSRPATPLTARQDYTEPKSPSPYTVNVEYFDGSPKDRKKHVDPLPYYGLIDIEKSFEVKKVVLNHELEEPLKVTNEIIAPEIVENKIIIPSVEEDNGQQSTQPVTNIQENEQLKELILLVKQQQAEIQSLRELYLHQQKPSEKIVPEPDPEPILVSHPQTLNSDSIDKDISLLELADKSILTNKVMEKTIDTVVETIIDNNNATTTSSLGTTNVSANITGLSSPDLTNALEFRDLNGYGNEIKEETTVDGESDEEDDFSTPTLNAAQFQHLNYYLDELQLICSNHGISPPKISSVPSSSSSNSCPYVLEIELLSAQHIPAMKRITQSSDPYSELALVSITMPKGISIEAITSQFAELHYDLLQDSCSIELSQPLENIGQGINLSILAYHRSRIVNRTCFPEWREYIKFQAKGEKPINDEKFQRVHILWVIVRDAIGGVKTQFSTSLNDARRLPASSNNATDEAIGQIFLSIDQECIYDRLQRKVDSNLILPHRIRRGRSLQLIGSVLKLTYQITFPSYKKLWKYHSDDLLLIKQHLHRIQLPVNKFRLPTHLLQKLYLLSKSIEYCLGNEEIDQLKHQSDYLSQEKLKKYRSKYHKKISPIDHEDILYHWLLNKLSLDE